MCDKEFKELEKIAVEKLKDESVLKLLQADASYQKDSNNEGSAEDAFHQLDLTEKQRAVCQHLLDCRADRCISYYSSIVKISQVHRLCVLSVWLFYNSYL